VAVLLGVLVLAEPFTATTAAGFLCILAGSVLATQRVSTPAATRAEALTIERPC
jgi:drug/metabolite transporter (DMT)-like permease